MAARLTALLPRLLALTVIWLLGAATYTLAADKPLGSKLEDAQEQAQAPAKPDVLTVPDVRRKAYVFAKGILQDAGFAWRVQGDVKGYAANTVSVQNPAPGAKVIDNGAPTVVLGLTRNTTYGESGLPENTASYRGTRIVLLSDWAGDQIGNTSSETTSTTETAPTTTGSTTTAPEPTTPEEEPEQTRKPDFEVAGAPAEPADEITLPARARALQRRVAAAETSSRRLVSFWLYQHSWIVTGARFGWHDGAEALRILIQVDRSLERRFGYGAKSEAVARRALAYVEAQAK
ncbi:MAG TPA: PASTA domain-containing protein [Gaiellaceae bacterium]|nr:PASTA domain-containing protein [Gaiellaceae bacterium]